MIDDRNVCKARGIGTVLVKSYINGKWSKIENIFFVPNFKRNLFSVGACTSRGYSVTFNAGVVNFSREKEIIAQGVK